MPTLVALFLLIPDSPPARPLHLPHYAFEYFLMAIALPFVLFVGTVFVAGYFFMTTQFFPRRTTITLTQDMTRFINRQGIGRWTTRLPIDSIRRIHLIRSERKSFRRPAPPESLMVIAQDDRLVRLMTSRPIAFHQELAVILASEIEPFRMGLNALAAQTQPDQAVTVADFDNPAAINAERFEPPANLKHLIDHQSASLRISRKTTRVTFATLWRAPGVAGGTLATIFVALCLTMFYSLPPEWEFPRAAMSGLFALFIPITWLLCIVSARSNWVSELLVDPSQMIVKRKIFGLTLTTHVSRDQIENIRIVSSAAPFHSGGEVGILLQHRGHLARTVLSAGLPELQYLASLIRRELALPTSIDVPMPSLPPTLSDPSNLTSGMPPHFAFILHAEDGGLRAESPARTLASQRDTLKILKWVMALLCGIGVTGYIASFFAASRKDRGDARQIATIIIASSAMWFFTLLVAKTYPLVLRVTPDLINIQWRILGKTWHRRVPIDSLDSVWLLNIGIRGNPIDARIMLGKKRGRSICITHADYPSARHLALLIAHTTGLTLTL